MKKAILALSLSLLSFFSSNAQCPANAKVYYEVIITSTDTICSVSFWGVSANSTAYLYDNTAAIIDSVTTDQFGIGVIQLFHSCLTWDPGSQNFGKITLGTCSLPIAAADTTYPIPVAIRLNGFSVNTSKNIVKINWRMENELQKTLYEIQQSADGLYYKTIYSTNSGTGVKGNYQYILPQAITSKQFYRLKYTAGTVSKYSETATASPENYGAIQVTPSVINNRLTAALPANYIGGELKIYNAAGVVVYQNKIINQQLVINANWSRGIYYIRAMAIDGNSSFKTIILQ